MNVITVLLVDDHRIVRQGIASILGDDDRFRIVGEAATGKEAVALVREHQPDAVLLDLKLPDLGGVALCQRILEESPNSAVLILTAFINHNLVDACLRSGARGYLLKDAENLHLKDQLVAAVEGHAALDPRAADVLTDFMRDHEPPPDALSSRQLEVMRLMGLGWTNKQIGEELFISENTVKGHVRGILAKLGAQNRVEALIRAREQGFL